MFRALLTSRASHWGVGRNGGMSSNPFISNGWPVKAWVSDRLPSWTRAVGDNPGSPGGPGGPGWLKAQTAPTEGDPSRGHLPEEEYGACDSLSAVGVEIGLVYAMNHEWYTVEQVVYVSARVAESPQFELTCLPSLPPDKHKT